MKITPINIGLSITPKEKTLELKKKKTTCCEKFKKKGKSCCKGCPLNWA
jgi:hypothetical protein